MPRACNFFVLVSGCALFIGGCRAPAIEPWWVHELGYEASEVRSLRVDRSGLPFVEVRINDAPLELLFDTGNMTGLVLSLGNVGQLKLPRTGEWTSVDADGSTGRKKGVRMNFSGVYQLTADHNAKKSS